MTTSESTPTAAAERIEPDRRRLYRAAGWGGIGAFAAWLVQPVLVSIVSPLAGDYVTHEYITQYPFSGVIGASVFTAIGVGLLFFVTSVHRLMSGVGPVSTSARVGQTLGLASGLGWFVMAGLTLAPYTSVGYFLSEGVPDVATQIAVYEALALVQTGVIMLYGVGYVGWLVMLATAGRRAGVVGWPGAIVALVGALPMVVTHLLPFQPPWGIIGGLAATLVLGIVFLVKARRAR